MTFFIAYIFTSLPLLKNLNNKKNFNKKYIKLLEFDWLIKTNSFLIGSFILILSIDYMANKQLDINAN